MILLQFDKRASVQSTGRPTAKGKFIFAGREKPYRKASAALMVVFTILASLAVRDDAWVASSLLAALAGLLAIPALWEAGAAQATLTSAIKILVRGHDS